MIKTIVDDANLAGQITALDIEGVDVTIESADMELCPLRDLEIAEHFRWAYVFIPEYTPTTSQRPLTRVKPWIKLQAEHENKKMKRKRK